MRLPGGNPVRAGTAGEVDRVVGIRVVPPAAVDTPLLHGAMPQYQVPEAVVIAAPVDRHYPYERIEGSRLW